MTIKEIAQLCGVSRGTVDRVLNNRGHVSPGTQALVLSAMEKAGYTKNMVGRALTVRKTNPVIGVVLASEGNPFFDDVLAGVHKAEKELTDYGVSVPVYTMKGYGVDAQLALVEGITPSLSALVLHPINHPRIRDKIDALWEKGIPTVTINTDIEGSARQCYVGSNYEKGGETAAGLLAVISGGKANLGIITGVETVLGHVQRLDGFEKRLRAQYPGIRVIARASAQDDMAYAYEATRAMLKAQPSLDTLFVVAAGVYGVCRAVIDLGLQDKIRVFAFDSVPSTVEMMGLGLIPAVVSQQPLRQGYEAVKAAFDLILTGQPSQGEKIYVEYQIKILENL